VRRCGGVVAARGELNDRRRVARRITVPKEKRKRKRKEKNNAGYEKQ
jgi:hypothetical protein